MEDRLIDRVFTELDNHSKRLEDLAEIVHTNAATLSLVSKLVVGIIIVMFGAGASTVYSRLATISHKPEPAIMTRSNIDKVYAPVVRKEGDE